MYDKYTKLSQLNPINHGIMY